MRKLLTLVILIYNMLAYLNRYVDSHIVDSNLLEQLNVLIINDGSKNLNKMLSNIVSV